MNELKPNEKDIPIYISNTLNALEKRDDNYLQSERRQQQLKHKHLQEEYEDHFLLFAAEKRTNLLRRMKYF